MNKPELEKQLKQHQMHVNFCIEEFCKRNDDNILLLSLKVQCGIIIDLIKRFEQ